MENTCATAATAATADDREQTGGDHTVPTTRQVIAEWLADSQVVPSGMKHRPAAKRLINSTLLPLARQHVPGAETRGDVPDSSIEKLLHWLEESQEALTTDLINSEDDVAQALEQDLAIKNDTVQEKTAQHLRALYAATLNGTAGEPLSPSWPPGSQVEAMYDLLVPVDRTATIKAWVTQAGSGSDISFDENWQSSFDRLWDNDGVKNLVSHPPSNLGLGSDTKPALTPKAGLVATDRAPFHRINLYWNSPHLPKDSELRGAAGSIISHPRFRFDGAPEPGVSIIKESIERTCSTYGLAESAHHVLLRLLHLGIDAGLSGDIPQNTPLSPNDVDFSSTNLTFWDTDAHPAVPDARKTRPSLNQACCYPPDLTPENAQEMWGDRFDFVAAVQAHTRATLVKNSINNASWHSLEATQITMRKTWLRMHGWELAGLPISPKALAKTIRATVDNAFNELSTQRPSGSGTRLEDSEIRGELPEQDYYRSEPGDMPADHDALLIQKAVEFVRNLNPQIEDPLELTRVYGSLLDAMDEEERSVMPSPKTIAKHLGITLEGGSDE